MVIETHPFTSPVGVSPLSDVMQMRFNGAQLFILVARERAGEGRLRGLEITFTDTRAFRVIDELNLYRYTQSPGFHFGHHVLSVARGGWGSEESELQGIEGRYEGNEWLIVTGNLCVSVFSHADPLVVETEFDDEP
jgi:hypothetical protein